jgi:hypothetical protein
VFVSSDSEAEAEPVKKASAASKRKKLKEKDPNEAADTSQSAATTPGVAKAPAEKKAKLKRIKKSSFFYFIFRAAWQEIFRENSIFSHLFHFTFQNPFNKCFFFNFWCSND